MNLLAAAVLVSLPWLSDSSESPAEPESPRTFSVGPIAKYVREFARKGDGALMGRLKSLEERQVLAREIGDKFSAEPPETWENVDNASELMRFVLFGGSAATLKKVIESGRYPKEFENTAKGIVAFSERQLDLAREFLVKAPSEKLPGHIAEPLALIRGSLLSTSDADLAIAEFRKVELSAPGTALEEAAVRQHVMTLIRHDRIGIALEKVRSYARRFPNSIYWRQFRSVAATGVATATSFDPAKFSAIEGDGLSPISLYRFREFSVEVGKQLALAGSFETALGVLGPSVKNVDRSSDLWRQADLYYNLAGIVGADTGAALDALRVVDIQKLPDEEKLLVKAGIALASDIKTGYRSSVASAGSVDKITRPRQDSVDRIQPLPSDLNDRAKEAIELAQKKLAEVNP